ncbi:MAG TPA: hypothetical protein PKC18_20330, partial [Lacipirellulaceae bacterium]|nr:hypothetical protein [Lacipirellulaceae bacterium]
RDELFGRLAGAFVEPAAARRLPPSRPARAPPGAVVRLAGVERDQLFAPSARPSLAASAADEADAESLEVSLLAEWIGEQL